MFIMELPTITSLYCLNVKSCDNAIGDTVKMLNDAPIE